MAHGTEPAFFQLVKLCVGNLARTDLTPRPAEVYISRSVLGGAPLNEVVASTQELPLRARMRQALSSLFDDEEEIPTMLYAPAGRS